MVPNIGWGHAVPDIAAAMRESCDAFFATVHDWRHAALGESTDA